MELIFQTVHFEFSILSECCYEAMLLEWESCSPLKLNTICYAIDLHMYFWDIVFRKSIEVPS